MAYTKLFQSILTSTIWVEDDKTRIVWITMLALADKNGEVQGSVPGLARMAGVDVEAADTALAKFMAPDRYSRTKDDEGRRIEEIDGGWAILNHRKYREMASLEERRTAEAERKARYRAKQARNVPDLSRPVPDKSRKVPISDDIAEAEAEAEAESDAEASPVSDTKQTPDTKKTRNVLSGKPDAAAVEILDYLNVKAGRQFRHTPANLKLITARLQSVNDPAGIKAMIDRMVRLWKGDPRMDQYLQPATLFGPQKFDGYYDLRDVPVLPEHGQPRRPGGHADHLHPEHENQTKLPF